MNKQEQLGLFSKLAQSLSLLNNPEEAANLLRDLLSESEVFMLARRLQIAELLLDGQTYEQIRESMKVGQSTIAKVQTWLSLYGEGYRTIAKRIAKKKENSDNTPKEISQIKKKYPAYFWPELLLEEMIKNSNKREKDRLKSILGQMKEKTVLSKQIAKLLQS